MRRTKFSILLQKLNEGSRQGEKELSEATKLKMMRECLDADELALYLYSKEDNNLFILKDHIVARNNNFQKSCPQADLEKINQIKYLSQDEKSIFFTIDRGYEECLAIPIYWNQEMIAFVLVNWIYSFSGQELRQIDIDILETIARYLCYEYHILPLLEKLRQREKNLTMLFAKAEKDLEDNRKEIFLELHDEVGQVLTSILLQLKLLQQSDDMEYIKGRLGGLHHIVADTLSEVRRISQNLRPNILEKMGLQAAVETHIRNYSASTNIGVELRTNNLDRRIPEQIENVIYRAVQEGLTNIARHAKASMATVSLTIKGNNVFLQIIDNGQGMEANTQFGTGLLGMQERTIGANGRFWIVNQAPEGVIINILIPLE